MKPRHAALVLVGWYLMLPPRSSDSPLRYATSLPLNQWTTTGSFDTAAQCTSKKNSMEQPLDADVLSDTTPREMKEKEMQMVSAYDEAAVCVASDDPRLKDK